MPEREEESAHSDDDHVETAAKALAILPLAIVATIVLIGLVAVIALVLR